MNESQARSRRTLQVGSFAVNCTILEVENAGAWIVDPGNDAERILAACAEAGLVPQAILLTHGHFDHIGGVAGLQQEFPDLPVYVGAKDRAVLTHPMNQLPPDYPAAPEPKNLRDAATLAGVQVLDTPGHTPGGVSYHFAEDGLLLAGDTLFAGSVGRTDLPGGDMATLMDSIRRLQALPDETLVIPGHGPFTTIGREKAGNPFMQ